MAAPDLRDMILAAWETNNRVTIFLVENLPSVLWEAKVPGAPRRTIRTIAAHLHNSRCTWVKMVGKEHGVPVPASVDRHRVSRKQLMSALKRSSLGISSLLRLACDSGGSIPIPSTYVWRNLPLDVGHVLSYFVAHEGHHRGQIVQLARQLGHRLSELTRGGLWQWTKRAKEVEG
jgi:uncharacterized damage-inducible protein DinB